MYIYIYIYIYVHIYACIDIYIPSTPKYYTPSRSRGMYHNRLISYTNASVVYITRYLAP